MKPIEKFKNMIQLRHFVGVVALGLCINTMADDTDIYFGTPNDNAALPLVMLTLDWRPNLISPQCDLDSTAVDPDTGDTVNECQVELGSRLYESLDKTTGTVTLFDTFRAVLRAVFEPLVGVRVGFMLNHDNTCSGNATICSNGAYVLSGFNEFTQAGYTLDGDGLRILNDVNKQTLLDKLRDIPLPQGNEAHSFQGKELYLELHQYLTGGAIVNGHKGYGDFASQNPGGTPSLNLDDSNNLNKRAESIPTSLAWDADPAVEDGINYISPYADGEDWSCSKTYAINTMFLVSQQEDDSDDELDDVLGWTGFTRTFPDVITALHRVDHAGDDHDITGGDLTGTVNVDGLQSVQSFFLVKQLNRTTLGYGAAGGGAAYEASEDPQQMIKDIEAIFSGILSVSSTFVAGSVPVNVINRSEVLDSVYFAIFEGDRDSRSLWPGNIKKFTLHEEVIDSVKLVEVQDVNGDPAFDPVTGRIAVGALSFWTDPDAYDVQAVEDGKEAEEEAGSDGPSVYRGGAGQRIPGFLDPEDNSLPGKPGISNVDDNGGQAGYSPRQIYLEPETVNNTLSSGNTLVDLSADINVASPSVTEQAFLDEMRLAMELPAASNQDVVDLLKWARGLDVDDLDGDGVTDEVRTYAAGIVRNGDPDMDNIPWMMGDVLHSRPKAINYGCTGVDCVPDIRLVFGANDGFFRMINDGENDQGEENWAFMPKEMLKNLSLWRSQTLQGYKFPYGVDGEPSIIVIDNDSDDIIERTGLNSSYCTPGSDTCDKVYAYFGLRRGGKSYYGLDFSNPDSPPAELWRVTKEDNPLDDFYELGLTFATPLVTVVQFQTEGDVGDVGFGDASTTNEAIPTPVVIVSGGYYGGWEDDFSGRIGKDDQAYQATVATPDAEGNAIFILHARTGELLFKVNLDDHPGLIHSIPSSITAWDENRNGITDRLYVGDSGGNVWRVDLPELTFTDIDGGQTDKRSDWFITKFAELGDTHRFFHKPDVSAVRDSLLGVKYDAVAIGSGDRAHPLETDTLNSFFLMKDNWIGQPRTAAQATSLKNRAPLTLTDLDNTTDICLNNDCPDSASLANGWSLTMEGFGNGDGEKVLSSPLIIAGEIFFTSYLPSSGDASCKPNEGESRLYIVSLVEGAPTRHLSSNIDSDFTKLDRYIHGGVGMVGDPLWLKDRAGVIGAAAGLQGIDLDKRFDVFWREAGGDSVH